MFSIIGLFLVSQLHTESLVAPEGFKINVFANNVINARQMASGENGTLFVGTRKAGKVYALLMITMMAKQTNNT